MTTPPNLNSPNSEEQPDPKWERFDRNMEYLKSLDRSKWVVKKKDNNNEPTKQ